MENSIQKAKILFQKKDYEKSLKIFLKLDQENPHNINNLIFISLNFMFLGRFQDAIKSLNQIESLNNKLPECYFNRALCNTQLKEFQQSINDYKKAINLKPSYHQAYVNLGVLLQDLGKLDDAIEVYKHGLQNVENKLDFYINLSGAYKLKHDTQMVKEFSLKALEIDDKNFFALNNLATSLIDEGDIDYAITVLEKGLAVNPNFHMFHNNLGIAYEIKGDYQKAIFNYETSIKIRKDFQDPYFNISQIQLRNNDFKNGWKNYEYRWGKSQERPTEINFSKPRWEPSFGFGRLLIWGEQGMGEQIIFGSILNDVIEKFSSIIFMVDERLCELFQESYPNIKVFNKKLKIDEKLFDYHLPIGSLALYFREQVENFNDKKILNLNSNKFQFNFTNEKKFKCAISWKSLNPYNAHIRSIYLNDLKNILKNPNIDFYDIQYTNEDLEIKKFEEEHGITIKQIENLDKFNDIYQLTHFINSCDFIISISNTNAHLAASLGKPVFLLLPQERGKFWYWDNMHNGKNLWYPSVCIFKQEVAGEWQTPIEKLREFIEENYLS